MNPNILKNEFGFYEMVNKPTEEDLSIYYAKKYYQSNKSSYQNQYSKEETQYLYNKIIQRHRKLIKLGLLENDKNYSLLDVGCGEGFTLKYFKDLNWEITGLDFSSYGSETINPECTQHIITGDIYANLNSLITSGKEYDVIWLDNVLEHVLDPFNLLKNLHKLSSSSGVLVIEVPNDFSIVQNHLLDNQLIEDDFWVVFPDHISYFNQAGLENICSASNWKAQSFMADFPIDFFLFNEHSNYKRNAPTGKAAHTARVTIENILHETSIDKTNSFYESMAELGIGRQITGIFTTKK